MSFNKRHTNLYVDSMSATTYYSGTTELSTIIGGGGSSSPFQNGNGTNSITTSNSSLYNDASGTNSFAVGTRNTSSSIYSTTVGGSDSFAQGAFSSVFGGSKNSASTSYSTVVGGQYNTIQGQSFGIIAGGQRNYLTSIASAIIGGSDNSIKGPIAHAAIIGGLSNSGSTNQAVIVGGSYNTMSGSGAYRSVIAGGNNNTIALGARDSFIAGGYGNVLSNASYNSAIIGSVNSGSYGSTSGTSIIGSVNFKSKESTWNSLSLGGKDNRLTQGGKYSTFIGGVGNEIFAGAYNSTMIASSYSKIAGSAKNGIIIGGTGNTIFQGAYSCVSIGGSGNTMGLGGERSFSIGGSGNTITGVNTIVLGANDVNANLNDTVYTPNLIVDGILTASTIFSGSNDLYNIFVEEAPSDGSSYVRKDNSWVTSSGIDTNSFNVNDGLFNMSGTTSIVGNTVTIAGTVTCSYNSNAQKSLTENRYVSAVTISQNLEGFTWFKLKNFSHTLNDDIPSGLGGVLGIMEFDQISSYEGQSSENQDKTWVYLEGDKKGQGGYFEDYVASQTTTSINRDNAYVNYQNLYLAPNIHKYHIQSVRSGQGFSLSITEGDLKVKELQTQYSYYDPYSYSYVYGYSGAGVYDTLRQNYLQTSPTDLREQPFSIGFMTYSRAMNVEPDLKGPFPTEFSDGGNPGSFNAVGYSFNFIIEGKIY